MKFVQRYFLSLVCLLFALIVLGSWWHSTREWSSWDAETPFGIFRVQSESSLFRVGAKVMQHEHRWSAFYNSDPVWDDHMKWLLRWPRFEYAQNRKTAGFFIEFPYWQPAVLLVSSALAAFLFRLRRGRRSPATTLR